MYQPPQNSRPYWQSGPLNNGTPLPPQNSGPYWQPRQFHNGTPSLPPPKPTVAQRFKSLPKKTQLGLGCGTLVLVLALCTCSVAVGSAGSQHPSLASTPAKVISTSQPTMLPTSIPTTAPTLPVTPKPTATPTQPPAPTQPPVPAQLPVPTQPPVAPQPTGINGNPWGYNFTAGNVIYSPSQTFCTYFACISNFWKGNGYVDECNDTTYSKSGGLSGACSRHGGEMRPLYSH